MNSIALNDGSYYNLKEIDYDNISNATMDFSTMIFEKLGTAASDYFDNLIESTLEETCVGDDYEQIADGRLQELINTAQEIDGLMEEMKNKPRMTKDQIFSALNRISKNICGMV